MPKPAQQACVFNIARQLERQGARERPCRNHGNNHRLYPELLALMPGNNVINDGGFAKQTANGR